MPSQGPYSGGVIGAAVAAEVTQIITPQIPMNDKAGLFMIQKVMNPSKWLRK